MPFLGFTHLDADSVQDGTVPRFYYGDVVGADSKGYWLLPDPTMDGAQCAYLQAPLKINIMGQAFFYIELDNYNCIDETNVFSVSQFTEHTNETSGNINASFFRIPIAGAAMTQVYDYCDEAYKLFNPPAPQIRTLHIRCRYHDHSPVYFGNFDFAITLEFALFVPQQKRDYDMYIPEST
jgi:hypothetical protein